MIGVSREKAVTGPEFPALWPAGCVVHRHLTAIGIEIGYGENQADFWRRAADVNGQIEAGQKQCTSEEACGLTTDWCRVHSSRDEAPEGGLFAAVHLQKGIRWRAPWFQMAVSIEH